MVLQDVMLVDVQPKVSPSVKTFEVLFPNPCGHEGWTAEVVLGAAFGKKWRAQKPTCLTTSRLLDERLSQLAGIEILSVRRTTGELKTKPRRYVVQGRGQLHDDQQQLVTQAVGELFNLYT